MSNRTFSIVLTSVCAYALLNFFPKSRLAILAATGRTGGCSVSDTINSQRHTSDLIRTRERIDAGARTVQLDGPLQLVDTPAGRWWVNAGDTSFGFVLSEQRHEIYGTGQDGVQPGDVVLDCGANYGAFTKTALRQGASKVVAIEISPDTIGCLRRNLAPEISDGRVIVYPKGVWDKPDFLELAISDKGNFEANTVVYGRDARKKVRVPVTTIDAIVEELRLDRVNFIKIDVEGAEKQALFGATNTLRRFHPKLALSSEHLADDYKSLPATVNGITAGYMAEATDCSDQLYNVRPQVLLFR